jgi:hypothetical protein
VNKIYFFMPINAFNPNPSNRLAYPDSIGPVPRNEYLGALADFLAKSYSPERTQQMRGVAEMLSLPAISRTVDMLSYGEPLTTGSGGLGGTTRPKADVVEAGLAVAPLTPAAALQSARLARQAALAGDKAAMAVGKAGERYAERVVPQIMERGGMPAQLLGDLSQGSIRKMYVPATQQEAFEASKLLKKNTPQEVWAKTGVAKYGDDFVKEISDKDAVAGFTHLEGVNNGDRLRELAFDNPQLYSLMPEAKKFGQLGLRENKMSGSFQGIGDSGTIIGYAPNEKDLKTVMAHEMQHGVQSLSGWERGGSGKEIAMDIAENKLKAEEVMTKLERMQNKASDEAKRASPELMAQASQWAEKNAPLYQGADKNMLVKDYLLSQDPVYASLYQNYADLAYNKPALLGPEETYRRLAGEAQARSTQNRVDLTDVERRQYFPFELKSEANPYGLDVAPEDLLFRSQMGENQLRRNPKAAMEDRNMLSYRGSHKAPGPDFGAPLHDLTGGGQMYPVDVYSSKAAQYYGTGYPKADKEAFALANRVRGNPDAEVTMYRAVPKDSSIGSINAGDWVTLSKDYAKNHGESVLDNDYKIISQKVKAKDLWTNADSIHEFGYHPEELLAKDKNQLRKGR